ncbi:MAG: hypothetical protein QNJ97_25400 [Myxococcota bacterium]|nr:hypothetical protein [Myxococcota bacterium]
MRRIYKAKAPKRPLRYELTLVAITTFYFIAGTKQVSAQENPDSKEQPGNQHDTLETNVTGDAHLELKEHEANPADQNINAIGATSATGKEFFHTPDGLVEVSFDVMTFFRQDRGYDLFTTGDKFANLGATAAFDLLCFGHRWILSAGLSWSYEKANSRDVFGGDFNTFWKAHLGIVGIKLRYRWTKWFSPHARFFGGANYTRAKLRDKGLGKNYFKKGALSTVGGAGLGAAIHTPGYKISKSIERFPIISLALLLEGGYAFGSGIELRMTSDESDEHAIELHEVSMGTLPRNAPYLLTSAVVRF